MSTSSSPLARAWFSTAVLCLVGIAKAASLPELPDGFASRVAAAPPLVNHPIMAALGERGQLFVGDAAGTNLNKAGLERQVPNRVLLLTDTNADGIYDRVSVFADQMTFPQGGVWLEGSFYVASPPGIWRLTDTNHDGVADVREMIVGGFEYTGNAADVHGPFLHPNGRLYWCHGRKGHTVKQRDGTLVHAGLASGIWSCRPDGLDVRWHALSCADNPTEIDFTPEGEIVGTVNLYYSGPRGDTLVHWLRGGVYEREDQLEAIAGLPRTLPTMPVAHNFGHVAVSGCAFYRSGALDPGWRGNLFVVHFNTQRVTRMETRRDGASYRFTEREFLKLNDPDAHLTDVLEDRDGSLLVVDTGGWFRIGCPSSVMAKPDVAGAIYRIARTKPAKAVPAWGSATAGVWKLARAGTPEALRQLTALLTDADVAIAHASANALASLAEPASVPALVKALGHPDPGVQLAAAQALGEMPSLSEPTAQVLIDRLDGDLDPAVEHQVMFALLTANRPALLAEALRDANKPARQRRALVMWSQMTNAPLAANDVLPLLDSRDAALAAAAAAIVAKHADWIPAATDRFTSRLKQGTLPSDSLPLAETIVKAWLAQPGVRALVAALAESNSAVQQQTAWRLLAGAGSRQPEPRWTQALESALDRSAVGDLPLVLEAAANLRTPELDRALKRFSDDPQHPLGLRLKALRGSIRSGASLSAESYELLLGVLRDQASASARLEAARGLSTARLTRDQSLQLAAVLPTLSPLELREIMRVIRSASDAEVGKAFATALTKSAAFGSFQESEIRTVFGNLPPECFAIVAPTLRELAREDDARRRKLETLPALVGTKGRAAEGRKAFATGKGACIVCHRIGEAGNLVGPNLTTIGRIRTERDLLESILFPSATIARDYEARAFELANGESFVGVISRSNPESVVVADGSGQQRTIPRAQLASMNTLPTSLMPSGLDHAVTEEELLDLVAFLRSCR
jgi:putative membrane-bound dehydrogenase-like protein